MDLVMISNLEIGWGNVVSLAVAGIAALAAWASQRSAAKASTFNTQTVTAVDREKEAYERARAFDTETIRRQDEEIAELRRDNLVLHERVAVAQSEAREARREARDAQAENRQLRERIAVLENHDVTNPHQ